MEPIELKDNDVVQTALKAKGMELANELMELISGGFGGYYSSVIANAEKKITLLFTIPCLRKLVKNNIKKSFHKQ